MDNQETQAGNIEHTTQNEDKQSKKNTTQKTKNRWAILTSPINRGWTENLVHGKRNLKTLVKQIILASCNTILKLIVNTAS